MGLGGTAAAATSKQPVPPDASLFTEDNPVVVQVPTSEPPTRVLGAPVAHNSNGGGDGSGSGSGSGSDAIAAPAAAAQQHGHHQRRFHAGPGGVAVKCQGGAMTPPVEFETDLFVGRFQCVFRTPPSLQSPESASLLEGRQRRWWFMCQGRVKRPVALGDLLVGQWYSRPLLLPAPYLTLPALEWLGRRLPGIVFQLQGDKPYLAGPVCASAMMVNVSRAGEEPRDLAAAEEDTRLLFCSPPATDGHHHDPHRDHQHALTPMTPVQRRAHFKHAEAMRGRRFEPSQVLTFHTYDHGLDWHDFMMHVPIFTFDMVRVMRGQPLGFMMQDASTKEMAFSVEVWQRRMLRHPDNGGDGGEEGAGAEEGAHGAHEVAASASAVATRFRSWLTEHNPFSAAAQAVAAAAHPNPNHDQQQQQR